MKTSSSLSPSRLTPWWVVLGIPLLWCLETAVQLGAAWITPRIFDKSFSFQEAPPPVALLATFLLSSALTLAVSWLFAAKLPGRPLSEAIGARGAPPKQIAAGLAAGVVMGLLASWLTSEYSTGESMFAQMAETAEGMVAVSVLAMVAAVVEEVYYRGYIFGMLEKIHPLAAFGVVSLWFWAIHIPQLLVDPVGIPVILVVSLVLTAVRTKKGSIWPTIAIHAAYNGTLVTVSWILFLGSTSL